MNITTENLQDMAVEAIEAMIWKTVAEFYCSVNSQNRIADMMHAHEDFHNAFNQGDFARDEDEVRECAEAIMEIYNDVM